MSCALFDKSNLQFLYIHTLILCGDPKENKEVVANNRYLFYQDLGTNFNIIT